MTPERWKQIDELAQAALDRGDAEREAFLDEACAGDDSLRREVESQIAYQQQASKFLEDPAFKHAAGLMADPQAETESMEGQTVSHYRILRKLGAGGMGEVYLAKDTTLDRKVAIKFLSQNSTAGEQARKRLVREARATAALDHPHICGVHEVGEEAGHSFIVMQYVEGENLAERMKREPLGIRNVLNIAVQIADALMEAHGRGIIHRDIKPANIMLRGRSEVKVLDFGLARVLQEAAIAESKAETSSHLSASGAIVGTVPYMSPEQVRGEESDQRSDIFSLAVVIYEMLSGQRPFAAESAAETCSEILSRKQAPLARYCRDVPSELERIVDKALSKDREERYQTVKDLLIDLRSLRNKLALEADATSRGGPAASTPTTMPVATSEDSAAAPAATVTAKQETEPARRGRHWLAIAAVAILAVGVAAYLFFYFARPAGAIDSIAVLPLANASNDPNTEYLSDGISEALINSLTELQQLRVIARSTASRYKGREVEPQAVGRELNVRAVLMGRVRQMGDTLNIQMDLVDATTGAQLWGEEYERKVSDVLAIKQAIAREVTEKLRLRLSGEERQRLVGRDTTNAEAYQFYLKGRYYWNKRTAEGIKKAIGQFEQSVDKDPNYALAYVGLADCYQVMEEYAGIPVSEARPKAKAYAERALLLDETLAEGHTSLAGINLNSWRFEEAEKGFKRALSLSPNYATAHHWYSVYFVARGRLDEALAEIKRAQELDRLSPVISENVAWTQIRKGDLGAAVELAKGVLDLDPNYAGAHQVLGWAWLEQRRYPEAIAELQKALDLAGRTAYYLAPLGYGYALAGKRAEALGVLKELEKMYARRESNGLYLAVVCAALGDKDQAFAWLEKDLETCSAELKGVQSYPYLASLQSDPRSDDLVRRMGLSPCIH